MGEGTPLLLVDDDPAVVRVTERLLTKAGWDVTTVADAAAAQRIAASTTPRVIVIDLGLKPDGGVSLARELLAAHPEVGLVFVSGAPPPRADQDWIDSIGAGFLAKPFSREPLLRSVADAAGAAQ